MAAVAAFAVVTTMCAAALPSVALAGLPSAALSLTGPTSTTLGDAATYTGSLTLQSIGVPAQEIFLLVDGSVATTVTTELDGTYAVPVTFAAYGGHTLQAITRLGTPLEVTSPVLQITTQPGLDPTEATEIHEATQFLYTGDDAVQRGVDPADIEPERVAVLRGAVTARDGGALGGVEITVAEHPEYGTSTTRPDGTFDLVLNGGQRYVVRFGKPGYLPVEREVAPSWRDYAPVGDVAMVPLDAAVTTITAGAGDMQVARSTVSADDEGSRRATLLFPAGTQAELVFADGSTSALSSFDVRATEYTVGEHGAAAMPREMPPTSAYTYAVDYTLDEAIEHGATSVVFDRPIATFTENFLEFPVGSPVPAGYYDSDRHAWVPAADGRVVEIVSITAARADLDLDGDGAADSAAELAGLGVTDAEREKLAGLYAVGTSLWRVPVRHFTPWDYNWPYGLPPGATPPSQRELERQEGKCHRGGSIVGCENQTLGEVVPITGTPFALRYESSRTPGYAWANALRIPLVGDRVPPDVASVSLTVAVAGRTFAYAFAPTPNLSHAFVWDGKDAYGRTVQGSAQATVSIGYDYRAYYYSPVASGGTGGFASSFAQAGSAALTGNRTRQEIRLTQTWQTRIGTLSDAALGDIGGWSLSPHHSYDPDARTLYLGDGTTRQAESVFRGIDTIAGNGAGGLGDGTYTGDGGAATAAGLSHVRGLAYGPDGSLYLADTGNGVVRRVDAFGVITTFAGGGAPAGGNGDGGAATAAALTSPVDIAVGGDGAVYILDANDEVVRRVDTAGAITTYAGGGDPADGLGDGGAATEAAFAGPRGLTAGSDGYLYVADTGHDRVRRIAPDGTITTYAGGGSPADGLGDGLPGPAARLAGPLDVTAGPGGSLFVADTEHNRVRVVTVDGIVRGYAGTGLTGATGDGGPATSAAIGYPTALAYDGANGELYAAQRLQHRVRVVDGTGAIRTAAGTGTSGYGGERGTPARAQLREPQAVAIAPQGGLVIADTGNFRVRRVAGVLPGFGSGDVLLPSSDGTEAYHFSRNGRHKRTIDALTGLVRWTFGYDDLGRVTTVSDRFGNAVTIERDGAGRPTAIVSPHGQRTTLATGGDGYLDTITNPAGEPVTLTYQADGLLTSLTNARGGSSTFTYDSLGRLTKDEGPDGGYTLLDRVETATGHRVVTTSAEGATTTIAVESLDSGAVRRTSTDPAGAVSVSVTTADGVVTATDPDGSVSTQEAGPDPRWGMQSPLTAQSTLRTPSGRTSTTTFSRTVTLADQDDPLSVRTLVDTLRFNGKAATSTYDASTRTLRTVSAGGRTRTITYDANGLAAQVADGTLAPAMMTYDARGRMTSVTHGSGPGARTMTYTYDAGGHVDTVTDPVSHDVLTHDAAGRELTEARSGGATVAYGRDAIGNMTSLTPAAGAPAYTFAYTGDNRVATVSAPQVGSEPRTTTYGFDLDQRLTSIARPDGRTVTFGYGTKDRLEQTHFSRGTMAYTYNSASQLTGLTAPGGEAFSRTHDGYLVTGVTASGSAPSTVAYGYDGNTRLSSLAVNGGSPVSFGYDDDGAVTSAGGMSLVWSTTNRSLTSTTIGSVGTAHGYNSFGEPTTTSATGGGGSLYSSTVGRDAIGRIEERTTTIAGATTVEDFAFDAAGRLTGVSRDGTGVEHYEYDDRGNRTRATVGGATTTATYDAQDRLTSYGGTTFTYLPSGELTTRTTAGATSTYDYDELGNLVAVTLPDGRAVTYVVDGENRRIATKVNGSFIQRFAYGHSNLPIAELDANGAVAATYVYASRSNVPDLIRKGGVTYRVVSDQAGSPRLVVNSATGAVVQRMDYDAFGNVVLDTNPGFQPFGFAGGLYDRNTGLVRFGARDYDPSVGRFTAKDPVGHSGGLTNLYVYVGNDPVNLIDPSGLDWLQSLSDFSAGFGDMVSFGLTRQVRQWMGVDDVVNYCSGWYKAGEVTGFVAMEVATRGIAGRLRGAATTTRVVEAETATARAYRLGREGERAAGIVKNTEVLTINGRGRIPDALSHATRTIGEVKNVQKLSYTEQLRDYVAYAQAHGYTFVLHVRKTTQLSGPLRDAVTRGDIVLRYLP